MKCISMIYTEDFLLVNSKLFKTSINVINKFKFYLYQLFPYFRC